MKISLWEVAAFIVCYGIGITLFLLGFENPYYSNLGFFLALIIPCGWMLIRAWHHEANEEKKPPKEFFFGPKIPEESWDDYLERREWMGKKLLEAVDAVPDDPEEQRAWLEDFIIKKYNILPRSSS